MQKAFTLDLNKCTGCQACEVACAVENELTPGTSWRTVDTFNSRHHPGIPVFHLSLACNHCVDAPCMEHCPALAYTKDAETGAVIIDTQSCIGCKYCTWACPYDAPRFDASAGVVTKCTFCNHRLQKGQRPACVEQCPTGALQIADLDAAIGVENTRGFPDTDARPAVRFVPLRGERPFPHASAPPAAAATGAQSPASKTSLRTEWPLVVFTLLTAALAGTMASPSGRAAVNGYAFVVLAALGAVFSTMHLGRKERAYRAVLNWKRSWLSREIILFSAFAAISTVHLFWERSTATGWAAASAGVATLFAMDRVYGVTRTPHLSRHSAQVVLTGALVLAVAGGSAVWVAVVAALKFLLYVERKARLARAGRGRRWVATIARVASGWALPAVLWAMGQGAVAVGSMAIGEVIDRCEFYLELDVPTPRKQLARDLAAEIDRAGATPAQASG